MGGLSDTILGLSWSWSHGSWISNYLCNQCTTKVSLKPTHGEVY